MTQNNGKYAIGFNDGTRGGPTLLGMLLQSDPDYQRGMQLGAAQATLNEVRSAQNSFLSIDATLQRGFAGLADVISTGQNGIIYRLDKTNDLLTEQIIIERIKNTLADVEPYLVKCLDFDASWSAGKSLELLKAETQQYVALYSALCSSYERIGRIPQLAPGAQAVDRMVAACKGALASRQEELKAPKDAVDTALEKVVTFLLKSQVSPLVVGIALDMASAKRDKSELLSTSIEREFFPYASSPHCLDSQHAFSTIRALWERQSAQIRHNRIKTAVRLFKKWAASPEAAPEELILLRSALVNFEALSGAVGASSRRPAGKKYHRAALKTWITENLEKSREEFEKEESYLATLMKDGVSAYCEAVANMAF